MVFPLNHLRPARHRAGGQISPAAKHSQENSNTQDGAEKGGSDSDSPKPVGFWDDQLRHVRRAAIKKWIVTTITLMAFVLAVLSLYWAVFFHVEKNLSALVVYIADFDGVAPYNDHEPFVGPMITKLGQQIVSSSQPHLGFESPPPSKFNNSPLLAREAVYNFEAWAAIIINPNATAMLYSAIATGNKSYDPMGACQLVYEDSRHDTNYYDFILPMLNQFMREAITVVGRQWTSMAMENASDPTVLANIRAVPQALSPAIGFSEYNLRPFYPYTAIPAVSIGLIYLIILSFFSFSFYLPIHMAYIVPKGHPPLKFWQLILWRYVATVAAYFFLALAYSLVSLAFHLNFTKTNPVTSHSEVTDIAYGNPIAYGHGTFVVYWMLNFWGMMALGLACENIVMAVGQPWMGFWLIFWVITNVSTSFYDIDIEPRFFYWGYAWPLHQVVEGSRSILFDLHSRIGLNFGILIAWAVVNTALFPLMCYFMRWKNKKNITEYWTAE